MTRQLVIDASPYSQDMITTIRAGLDNMLGLLKSGKLDISAQGSSSSYTAHAEFRLYNIYLQELPSRRDRIKAACRFTALALSPKARWIGDQAELIEVQQDLKSRWEIVRVLLEEENISLDKLEGYDGGGWRKATLHRSWNPTQTPIDHMVERLFADAPNLLWVRRENGNRKWNLRFGRNSAIPIPMVAEMDAIQRLRTLATYT